MDLINIMNTAFDTLCGTGGTGRVIIDFVSTILTVIQIAVPILLIIFGSFDLAKAVMAGKEDEIKKSQGTFIKRAIAAIIVFFVPIVVNIVLGLVPMGETETGKAITWQECKAGSLNNNN